MGITNIARKLVLLAIMGLTLSAAPAAAFNAEHLSVLLAQSTKEIEEYDPVAFQRWLNKVADHRTQQEKSTNNPTPDLDFSPLLRDFASAQWSAQFELGHHWTRVKGSSRFGATGTRFSFNEASGFGRDTGMRLGLTLPLPLLLQIPGLGGANSSLTEDNATKNLKKLSDEMTGASVLFSATYFNYRQSGAAAGGANSDLQLASGPVTFDGSSPLSIGLSIRGIRLDARFRFSPEGEARFFRDTSDTKAEVQRTGIMWSVGLWTGYQRLTTTFDFDGDDDLSATVVSPLRTSVAGSPVSTWFAGPFLEMQWRTGWRLNFEGAGFFEDLNASEGYELSAALSWHPNTTLHVVPGSNGKPVYVDPNGDGPVDEKVGKKLHARVRNGFHFGLRVGYFHHDLVSGDGVSSKIDLRMQQIFVAFTLGWKF